MPSITAIEFGAGTCALARASVGNGAVRVVAATTLDPLDEHSSEVFVAALARTRRTMKLPSRARAVIWGLPEGATAKEASVKPLIAPLTAAGFRVERVVSPCNALAALARVRRPRSNDGAICWVALNRGGVAIVVVRPGQQLYAHSFLWNSTVGTTGSQARLLQRYSLVSFLSPEVKRAIAEARRQGTSVDAVVTCGNLPDLRSLTMPLIEELDVEVETLDSLDGLVVNAAAADRIGESAPAIRLACAGAFARRTRPWDEDRRQAVHWIRILSRAAALAAGILIIGLGWFLFRPRDGVPIAPAPVHTQGLPPSTQPIPPAALPAKPPKKPGVFPIAGATDTPQASSVEPKRRGRSSGTATPERPRPSTAAPVAVPLADPLPRVTAILVANDRRFATVGGGRIVGIGDVLGRRIVTGIDRQAVTLREPSGVQIRVGLGGRILGSDRRRD